MTTGAWYELREAARFGLYNWAQFEQLSSMEQAGVVAHYRTHNKLHALIDQYQTQHMESAAKSKAGKSRAGTGRR